MEQGCNDPLGKATEQKGTVHRSHHNLSNQVQAVVVSLPTIESSFAIHSSSALVGFEHPHYPALRIALEVLDGTESFLWVSRKSERDWPLNGHRNIFEELVLHMALIRV
jgi:hypothetical protein